ncbi:hypothetical protein EW146_g8382 [Bondarzewia mesenterica]|uniref:Integrase catalytic domain-containing protein n=1 Tax=Bondarzewia mesenterica TaxID=1095465 RepID=A0A4S4LKD4_9AGAM|nr:hypothetical protein EW146_g8382 [Bondarzewia mesenterica]
MLQQESSAALADWIFEDILCRWGALCEIVSDNGSAFVKALTYLVKKYHVHHIRISSYNSHVNVSLDITEATYLLPSPSSFIFSTDLIAHHAITLQKCKSNLTSLHSKVYEAHIQAAIKFECDHIATIHDFNFQPSSLILM